MIQAALGEQATIMRLGEEVVVRVRDFLVMFALATEPLTGAEIAKEIQQQLQVSKRRGNLPDPSLPVLVLSLGHVGALPSGVAPENLVDISSGDHLIDGPRATGDRWLDLAHVTGAVDLTVVRDLVRGAVA